MLKLREEEEKKDFANQAVFDEAATPIPTSAAMPGYERFAFRWIGAAYIVLGLVVASTYRQLTNHPGESGFALLVRLVLQDGTQYVGDWTPLPLINLVLPYPLVPLVLLLFPSKKQDRLEIRAAVMSILLLALVAAALPIRLSSGICFAFAAALLGNSALTTLAGIGEVFTVGRSRFQPRRLSLVVGILTLGALVLFVLEALTQNLGR